MNLRLETSSTASAPSLALFGVEPLRAAIEYAGMRLARRPATREGDGHPVVIFPGLASDKHAIAPLLGFCEGLGYAARDWGLGLNTGPKGDPNDWLDDLAAHVDGLVPGHRRISLVGWSLGGIYAREVAKRLERRVRQVITIGTPFAGSPDQTNVGFIYRLLNGQKAVIDEALSAQLRTAPNVPTTSIYSCSDGIVAWQACIQPEGRADTENIRVDGSHCGLGWNNAVFNVLADRLRQPDGAWQPHAAVA